MWAKWESQQSLKERLNGNLNSIVDETVVVELNSIVNEMKINFTEWLNIRLRMAEGVSYLEDRSKRLYNLKNSKQKIGEKWREHLWTRVNMQSIVCFYDHILKSVSNDKGKL